MIFRRVRRMLRDAKQERKSAKTSGNAFLMIQQIFCNFVLLGHCRNEAMKIEEHE